LCGDGIEETTTEYGGHVCPVVGFVSVEVVAVWRHLVHYQIHLFDYRVVATTCHQLLYSNRIWAVTVQIWWRTANVLITLNKKGMDGFYKTNFCGISKLDTIGIHSSLTSPTSMT
jgi:hypothetical protein